MPETLTDIRPGQIKIGPEIPEFQDLASLTLPSDQDAYKRLADLALNLGWESTEQVVGQGSLLITDNIYCNSNGPGGQNPWHRVVVMGQNDSFVTMELQPIFEKRLDAHTSAFVRVLNYQYNNVMPTLNVLEPNPTRYGRILRSFVLPECIHLEQVTPDK